MVDTPPTEGARDGRPRPVRLAVRREDGVPGVEPRFVARAGRPVTGVDGVRGLPNMLRNCRIRWMFGVFKLVVRQPEGARPEGARPDGGHS
jgi:hypothetical protein